MPQLEFQFQEVLDEVRAVQEVTAPFVEPSAAGVWGALAASLEAIRGFPQNTPAQWEIPNHSPLCTRLSVGGYEPEGLGAHNVFSEITSTWLIAPSDPQATNRRPAKTFRVVGNASVRIRLKAVNGGHQSELAMWRAELGDDASPGCFFHVQVLGELAEPPFPHSLCVPRLPSIVFTPMAALEFVIGELFQDEWKEYAVQETNSMNRWKSIQRSRLTRLLQWKVEQVEDCVGSPWTALKLAKPQTGLFI